MIAEWGKRMKLCRRLCGPSLECIAPFRGRVCRGFHRFSRLEVAEKLRRATLLCQLLSPPRACRIYLRRVLPPIFALNFAPNFASKGRRT